MTDSPGAVTPAKKKTGGVASLFKASAINIAKPAVSPGAAAAKQSPAADVTPRRSIKAKKKTGGVGQGTPRKSVSPSKSGGVGVGCCPPCFPRLLI